MKFNKESTQRGFGIIYFNDDYDEKCSLQESSAVEKHIWLGIADAKPIIMCSDARKLNLPYAKNENGWQKYEIPEEVFINTRMHLTRRQAIKLAKKLFNFGLFGKI